VEIPAFVESSHKRIYPQVYPLFIIGMRMKIAGFPAKIREPVAKPPGAPVVHAERREEPRILQKLRSFIPFRMTGKIGFAPGSREM
jgi:hypothetical protein